MEKSWIPKTKTGRLVKSGKIRTIDELLASKLPIKEPEILDKLVKNLVETTLKTMNIGSAGEYRRKAIVAVTCPDGYVGFGKKCDKNTKLAVAGAAKNARLKMFKFQPQNQTVKDHIGIGEKYGATEQKAIRAAEKAAFRNIRKIRLFEDRTVRGRVTGRSGGDCISLSEAPKGTGIVGSGMTKALLNLAGIQDCFVTNSNDRITTVRSIKNALSKLNTV